MSFVNFSTKEITSKIVYYGPGLCGKTTTLQYIYDSIVPENKGQIVSLATDVDRTIYFDFLPLKLGKIQSFSVRIQLYTVPGQVRYNSTRKLVLSGTDGVVFVADSQRDLMEENLKSHRNLVENLREHGLSLQQLPHIFQLNKRDLPRIASVDEMSRTLNPYAAPVFETCATTGEGVLEGLKTISKLVMQDLNRKGVVNRRAARGQRGVTHTDTALRPVVGTVAANPVGISTVVEEYEDPFFRDTDDGTAKPAAPAPAAAAAQPVEGPAADRKATLAFPEADEAIEALLPARDRDRERRRAPAVALSLGEAFEDPALAERMRAINERFQVGDSPGVQKLVKEQFYELVEDARFFPPDMTESSRISMLGISLRKYAHFYRLLSQPSLTRPESLFLVHFLVDVQFGKAMP